MPRPLAERSVADPQNAAEWMAKLGERFSRARLSFGHGADSPAAEALWLVAHVLRLDFDELAADTLRKVTWRQARKLDELAHRRITERRPLAYLLNEAWLGPYRFYVDERTIVPRSFIAHWLLEGGGPWMRRRGRVRHVLDLCTGSGCLAVLAALVFTRATIDAVDISRESLAVARRNIRAHGVSARVRLCRGDLFCPLGGKRYDLIVANPPYVDRRGMQHLPPEYAAEPVIALQGGRDGLDVIRPILARAHQHMRPGGLLIMEVGRNRRRIEARYPRLPLTWLQGAAGNDMVLMATPADLELIPEKREALAS